MHLYPYIDFKWDISVLKRSSLYKNPTNVYVIMVLLIQCSFTSLWITSLVLLSYIWRAPHNSIWCICTTRKLAWLLAISCLCYHNRVPRSVLSYRTPCEVCTRFCYVLFVVAILPKICKWLRRFNYLYSSELLHWHYLTIASVTEKYLWIY